MKKEWQNLLLKSLDKKLSAKEADELSLALEQSPELQKEQADLLKMRRLFASFSVKEDSDFIDKVMNAIKSTEIIGNRNITHYLSIIYPKAVAACLVILMSFIIYIYLSEGSLDTETLVGLNDLSPDEAYSFLIED